MELNEYVATLRKHAASIVVIGLLGALAGFGYATAQPSVYTARISFYVAVQGGETVGERAQGATYAEGRIASYAELARQPFVLEPVIDELGLTSSVVSVARNVTTTTTLNTAFLEIAYTHQNPARAAEVANAIGGELARAVADLEGDVDTASGAVELTVVAAAEPPTRPSAPNTRLLVAGGLFLGLALGVALALGRGIFDTRVRGTDDIQRVTDRAVLGIIRRKRRHRGGLPAGLDGDPLGEQADAYRRLRTNVQLLDPSADRSTLIITSSVDGEGKTAVATNLAVSLAERYRRVLLIDANVHHPAVAAQLGLDGATGLMTVLLGEASEGDVVQPWRDRLDVLACGTVPSDPSDLLDSPQMAALMERLRNKYDAIVVDAPALLSSVDGMVLSRLVDGVLHVVGSSAVRRAELKGALQALEGVDAPLLGLVLYRTAGKGTKAAYPYTAAGGPRHAQSAATRGWSGDGDVGQPSLVPPAAWVPHSTTTWVPHPGTTWAPHRETVAPAHHGTAAVNADTRARAASDLTTEEIEVVPKQPAAPWSPTDAGADETRGDPLSRRSRRVGRPLA